MMRYLRLAAYVALAACLAVCAISSWQLWQETEIRERVREAAAGDIGESEAFPPVLVAHAEYLLAHGKIDAAQAVADRLGPLGDIKAQARLLTAIGNAYLRSALIDYPQQPFRIVAPRIRLAKVEYHRALQLNPDDWNTRYNFTIAAALVRDTESVTPTSGSEMAHERAAWPDISGAPNGMP